ncbi:MAG TPA: lecithin retinol acyltransferase family protein [Albitalea sp.]|uniref:lecithin retinol acyltransferase family protein n=1 Tax=Piscinibacter sp. TaxID=1903157 RepID=UPI002ED21F48
MQIPKQRIDIMPLSVLHYQLLPAGTVVSVQRPGYRHFGLLAEASPWGPRRIISLNPGPLDQQVSEESMEVFAQGEPLRVEPMTGRFEAAVVLARARSGRHQPYSTLAFNCEHFVRFAHGLPLESPQIRAAVALVAGAVLFWATGSSARP